MVLYPRILLGEMMINFNRQSEYYKFERVPFVGELVSNLSYEEGFQNYKYNGKEMDRMYGLDTYDHGARQYNPARITWDRMDQLAEKYYNVSPYVYCAGNPIRFIDSNGLEPTPAEAARIANTLSFCIVPISQRTLF